MDHEAITNFIKLNTKIYRNTQIYLDKVLKEYELSSGACPYLFILDKNEGISQNKISKIISNDKAMSARTIAKLIQLGFVYKEQDEQDSRANKLYLTVKAKELMPEIYEKYHGMINLVTEELSEEEKQITMNSLKRIYDKTHWLNARGEIE
jgi:DNA-binding MarR family transcriptional regulator